MKKTLVAGFAGLLAAVAFAGKDNVVVNFHTTGPDKYADGTTVVDGEYYALVYTPAGEEFKGINADGSAVAPSKVALKAPLAKNGKCPFVTFQLTEEEAKAYGNGTWAVYLLDTRSFAEPAADGSLAAATAATGKTTHGYSLAATASSFASVSAGATTADGLPADRSDAKITNIKLVDGKVLIYVTGTSSAATYALNAGDAPNASEAVDAQAGDTTDEIVFVRDQKAGGEFFSVNRK